MTALLRSPSKMLVPVFALILPAVALAGEVSLSGEGKVSYTPDSARLQFTASAERPDTARATREVRETMTQWREAIADYRDQLVGYSDASLTLYQRPLPVESPDQPPQTIAVASQTVSFEIHDLGLLNPILAQAQSLGMNYHLGQQQFFHSDETTLRRQALAQAIADAREQCEFVAGELGRSCGPVETISVSHNGGPRPMMMEARASSDSVSDVGPRELSASVNATFSLE